MSLAEGLPVPYPHPAHVSQVRLVLHGVLYDLPGQTHKHRQLKVQIDGI